MKELSIEEKSKRYDVAIERAKEMIKAMTNIGGVAKVDDIQYVFHELAESEDERIRKWIIAYLENRVMNTSITDEKDNCLNAIRWLEKQGEQKPADVRTTGYWHVEDVEQKPADKVKPKFKTGDIIIPKDGGHEPWQIMQVDILDKKYRFKDGYVIHFSQEDDYELVEHKPADKVEPKFKVGDWVVVDGVTQQITQIRPEGFDTDRAWNGKLTFKDVHLWTIKDSKEGDVLSYRDGQWIFIYKEKIDDNSFCYHALYSTIHQDLTINDAGFTLLDDAIVPATKEQRDLLFQKMKEAGYEWDTDKLQLNKIQQKTVELIEDDSLMIDETIFFIQEFQKLDICKDRGYMQNSFACINWLKSLRPQNHWKPSEEQMGALDDVISSRDIKYDVLSELWKDLKKLREE